MPARLGSPKREPEIFVATEHFRTLTSSRVTLTFDEINKILTDELCASARKYKDYRYRRDPSRAGRHDRISECWIANGYKIIDLDLEKRRVCSAVVLARTYPATEALCAELQSGD